MREAQFQKNYRKVLVSLIMSYFIRDRRIDAYPYYFWSLRRLFTSIWSLTGFLANNLPIFNSPSYKSDITSTVSFLICSVQIECNQIIGIQIEVSSALDYQPIYTPIKSRWMYENVSLLLCFLIYLNPSIGYWVRDN